MEASSTNNPSPAPTGKTINRDQPEHPHERLNYRPKGYMESLRVDKGLSGGDQGAVIPPGEVLSPNGPEVIIPNPPPVDPDPTPTNPDVIHFFGSTLTDDASIYVTSPVPGLEAGMLIDGPNIASIGPPLGPYDPTSPPDPYDGHPYIGGFSVDQLQVYLSNGSPSADQSSVEFIATRFTPPDPDPIDPGPLPGDPEPEPTPDPEPEPIIEPDPLSDPPGGDAPEDAANNASALGLLTVSRRRVNGAGETIEPTVASIVTTSNASQLARDLAIPPPSLLRVRRVSEARPVAERFGDDLSATALRAVFLARISRFTGLRNTVLVRQAIGQEGIQFMNELRERGVSVEVIKEAMYVVEIR